MSHTTQGVPRGQPVNVSSVVVNLTAVEPGMARSMLTTAAVLPARLVAPETQRSIRPCPLGRGHGGPTPSSYRAGAGSGRRPRPRSARPRPIGVGPAPPRAGAATGPPPPAP